MNEAINAFRVIISFHLNWKCTINRNNTYRTNSTPCAIPTDLTNEGSLYKYFMGMAIPSNNRKEIPSKKAKTLRKKRECLIRYSIYRLFYCK